MKHLAILLNVVVDMILHATSYHMHKIWLLTIQCNPKDECACHHHTCHTHHGPHPLQPTTVSQSTIYNLRDMQSTIFWAQYLQTYIKTSTNHSMNSPKHADPTLQRRTRVNTLHCDNQSNQAEKCSSFLRKLLPYRNRLNRNFECNAPCSLHPSLLPLIKQARSLL